jgi:NAD(P)-dependent dehydrogenase (short-subunit alcohol dehydrogenase family)
MFNLEGQTAVVAGAAGEIGAAAASLLAELGAAVWLTDVDADRLVSVRSTLADKGYEVHASTVDSTVSAEVEGVIAEAMDTWTHVDIAVNTVGWTGASPFVEEDEPYWRRIIELNLVTSVLMAKATLPRMIESGYGRLILVSSMAGRVGRPERVLYSAAKAGVIGLVKGLALEMAPHEITVNAVAPGATETALMRAQGTENLRRALALIPRGRMASPRDQAVGIAFLASREAAHITGQTLAVDGGATMV